MTKKKIVIEGELEGWGTYISEKSASQLCNGEITEEDMRGVFEVHVGKYKIDGFHYSMASDLMGKNIRVSVEEIKEDEKK